MLKTIITLAIILFSTVVYSQSSAGSAKTVVATGMIYDSVDVHPKAEFSIPDFLARTIRYPDFARENNIEGRVLVKFVINEDGSITEPVIIRSPHESLSADVLRVIGLMPKWSPGLKNGKPVKVYFTLPIEFRLEGRSRRRRHRED